LVAHLVFSNNVFGIFQGDHGNIKLQVYIIHGKILMNTCQCCFAHFMFY
jgi:hypothetical protein